MPARLPSEHDKNWTDDLTLCNSSGIGHVMNISYRHNGQPIHEHDLEDTWFNFQHNATTSLYGLFDGHDGKLMSEYAVQKLPAELFLGQLDGKQTDDEIRDVLKQAFAAVERDYFHSIGDSLAKRTNLLTAIPENLSSYRAAREFPNEIKELEDLNQRVASGSSAIVVLMHSGRLYVASVGNCRALLCRTDANGRLRVIQLNNAHDMDNPDELMRLTQLGLSVDAIRHMNHPTRCFGDFPRKGGYKDIDFLKDAKCEPVIADPEISAKIQLDSSCHFLLLMSSGVYTALQDATGHTQVNSEIAALTVREFRQRTTLLGVAQAVVDELARRHNEAFFGERSLLCQQREDMTVLIRNFNHPFGHVATNTLSLASSHSDLGGASNTLTSTVSDNNSTNASQTLTNTFIGTNSTAGGLTSNLPNTNSTAATNWSAGSDEDTPAQEYSLQLDEDGRVEAYVDFAEFYEALRIRRMQVDASDDPQQADEAQTSDLSESVSSVED